MQLAGWQVQEAIRDGKKFIRRLPRLRFRQPSWRRHGAVQVADRRQSIEDVIDIVFLRLERRIASVFAYVRARQIRPDFSADGGVIDRGIR